MFFKKAINKLVRKSILKLGILIHGMNGEISRETLPRFGNSPKNLKIDLPRRIIHPEHMIIGDDVCFGPGTLLTAITSYPPSIFKTPEDELFKQEFLPKITIGNRVTATADLQIAAHHEITVEDDVLFASNINITDGLHGYENVDMPYKYQKIFRIAPIRVKRGCWIGQNVVIMPGVTIGELSIIGANSVVTKSIPDRCIAFGTPAKVKKKWDENEQRWLSA